MNLSKRLKYKYLQRTYKPGKPKAALGFPKKFFDEIEDFLTPESEKKKDKKEDDKNKK